MSNAFGGSEIRVGWVGCDCPEASRAREADAEAVELEAERASAESRLRDLSRCGIKRRFIDAESPESGRMADLVRSGKSLYLWGPNGTGKTTLASAIARDLYDSGTRPLLVNSVEMLIDVQSTYGTPERESDVLERYQRAPVLIIDDMGKEQQTEWTASRLYAVVNARYEGMLPLVVTSNLKLSELTGRMADTYTACAVVSRLAGMCEQVEMTGPDRRAVTRDGNQAA